MTIGFVCSVKVCYFPEFLIIAANGTIKQKIYVTIVRERPASGVFEKIVENCFNNPLGIMDNSLVRLSLDAPRRLKPLSLQLRRG